MFLDELRKFVDPAQYRTPASRRACGSSSTKPTTTSGGLGIAAPPGEIGRCPPGSHDQDQSQVQLSTATKRKEPGTEADCSHAAQGKSRPDQDHRQRDQTGGRVSEGLMSQEPDEQQSGRDQSGHDQSHRLFDAGELPDMAIGAEEGIGEKMDSDRDRQEDGKAFPPVGIDALPIGEANRPGPPCSRDDDQHAVHDREGDIASHARQGGSQPDQRRPRAAPLSGIDTPIVPSLRAALSSRQPRSPTAPALPQVSPPLAPAAAELRLSSTIGRLCRQAEDGSWDSKGGVGMRIVVTGAAGFLGTHVVRRLVKDGHTVTGFDQQCSLASRCSAA